MLRRIGRVLLWLLCCRRRRRRRCSRCSAGRRTASCRSPACRPSEQIPAAPLVIGAYAFFLVLMMFYLWTIWRRIGKVEADMHALERRQTGGSQRR